MEFQKITDKEFRAMNRQQRKLFKAAGGEVVVPAKTQALRVLSLVFIIGVGVVMFNKTGNPQAATTEDQYYNLAVHACAETIKQGLNDPSSMIADTVNASMNDNSRGNKIVSFKFQAKNSLNATLSKTGACEISPYNKNNTEAFPDVLKAKVI